MIREILKKEAEARDNLILKISVPCLIISELAHIYYAYLK